MMKNPIPATLLSVCTLAAAQPPLDPVVRGKTDQAGAQATTTDASGVRLTRSVGVLKDLRAGIQDRGTTVRLYEFLEANGTYGFRQATCPVDGAVYRGAAGSAPLGPVTLDMAACEVSGVRPDGSFWPFEGTITVAATWGQALDVEQGTMTIQRTIRGSGTGGYRESCQSFNGQFAKGSATIGDFSFQLGWDWGTEAQNQYSYFGYRDCNSVAL